MVRKSKYSRISELAGTRRQLASGGTAEKTVDALGEGGHHRQRPQSLVAARAAVEREAAAVNSAQHRARKAPTAGPKIAAVDQARRRLESTSQDRPRHRVRQDFLAQLVGGSLFGGASGDVL